METCIMMNMGQVDEYQWKYRETPGTLSSVELCGAGLGILGASFLGVKSGFEGRFRGSF
jgi:hypothetical protein